MSDTPTTPEPQPEPQPQPDPDATPAESTPRQNGKTWQEERFAQTYPNAGAEPEDDKSS
jgi:hypothetical protein